MQLENIEYPAAFGPKGQLLGIATSKDIKEGEYIIRLPSSARIDYGTIMKSDIGKLISDIGVTDEELTLVLWYAN